MSAAAAEARDLPVTFSSFLVSLATSAMMHLGEAPDPISRKTEVNLTLARNTIDLLGLLKEKTSGNLDSEESRLLETLLYELRVKYVEYESRQTQPATAAGAR